MPDLATLSRPPRPSLRTLLDDVALTIVRIQNGRLLAAREHAAKFPPSGCRHCNIGHYGHWSQWSAELHAETGCGWHVWTPPASNQIKTRMLARRNERVATPTRPAEEAL